MVLSCGRRAYFSICFFSQPSVSRLFAAGPALSRTQAFAPSEHLDRVKFRLVSF